MDLLSRALVFGLIVSLASACGAGGNSLQGSVEGTLSFDDVQAEWISGDLVIRYTAGAGQSRREPARLTVPGNLAKKNTDINMLGNVRVEHFVVNLSKDGQATQEAPFPALIRGKLRFDEVGAEPGRAVKGKFNAAFEEGKNLDGTFDAKIRPP